MKNLCPSTLMELIKQYQIVHKQKNYGTSGENKAKWIVPYLQELKPFPQTVLDYGCGRCNLVKTLEVEYIWQYDPAIEEFAAKPKRKFDVIICTDVLEHIYEKDLTWILKDIRSFSHNVFFTICTRIAAEILPDGSNAHKTIKSSAWWQKKIQRFFIRSDLILSHEEGCHIKTW